MHQIQKTGILNECYENESYCFLCVLRGITPLIGALSPSSTGICSLEQLLIVISKTNQLGFLQNVHLDIDGLNLKQPKNVALFSRR